MGPRLISRGVMNWGRRAWGCPQASMGPRLISRGVQPASAEARECNWLQWGRGSLAAA